MRIRISTTFAAALICAGFGGTPENLAASVTPEPVQWTDLVNAVADGSDVAKSGGCDGCLDSGAASVQQIQAGEGYIEFTVPGAGLVYGGLSNENISTHPSDVEFAIRVGTAYAEVRENNVFKYDTPFASGDVFKISIENGQVIYHKNGSPFYTNTSPNITYPILFEAILASSNTEITNAKIAFESSTPPPTGGPVTWTDLVNVTPDGNSLTKTGGCDGCLDAGAASVQAVEAGDGFVEFVASETYGLRYIGLSHGNDSTHPSDIDFGLRLNVGYAEVRESNVFKWDTPFDTGDVFRIAVEDGEVRYSKNGTIFYTNTSPTISYPLLVDTTLATSGSTITDVNLNASSSGPGPGPGPGQAPGGFIEDSTTAPARGLYTAAEIASFLPTTRGAFDFPAPYGTRGYRITNAGDCGSGDCVEHVGYSYWRNTNNHVGEDEILIVLGMRKAQGGNGPTLFSFNKTTEVVSEIGPLFDASSNFSNRHADGWYFSGTMPHSIYLSAAAVSPKFLRYNVIDKTFDEVFDVTTEFGPGHYIWQMHSSNDDRVHAGTLRENQTWATLGCFVYFEDENRFEFFAKQGSHDECQIDKSGRYLVIKENVTGTFGSDNRIIDLQLGTEVLLTDQDGAGGHSDLGYGVMVAADNWWQYSDAWRTWNLAAPAASGEVVYHTDDAWDAEAPNHVSFSHAKPNIPLADQYACGSNSHTNISRFANEVICFRLRDDTNDTLVVAPVMTDRSTGGGMNSYERYPKGNLDITGEYFIWTSNMGTNRLDAFIVKVPAHLLYAE